MITIIMKCWAMPHNDQACPAILCRRLSRHPASAPQRAASRARQGGALNISASSQPSPGAANIEMYVSMLEIWSGSIYQDNTSIYFYIRHLSIDIYYWRHTFYIISTMGPRDILRTINLHTTLRHLVIQDILWLMDIWKKWWWMIF